MSSNQENKENNEEKILQDYIDQLGEKEKIAYEIAKDHLGTSFSLKKSIGYKKWIKQWIKAMDKSNG